MTTAPPTAAAPLAPAGVTIIVVNWNRRDDTLACLESLAAADLGGATVTVVDNGSRDGSVDAIHTRFPAVQVIALPENRGFAGGNNAGMRRALDAGATAVLLLNNDTRVSPDFLGPLVQALNDSPEAAAVTAAIMRLDRPDMLDVAYSEVRLWERHAVQLRGVNALAGQGFDTRRVVDVATGCCVLMRGDALRAIGLFDEAYFAYHEDVDWCLRAHKAGWTILFEPFARVLHRGSGTTKPTDRPLPPPSADDPDLPNAEPLPWNPVRTYLGARNLARLVKTHATEQERKAFVKACLREIPLEVAALVMGREGWLRLGRFDWPSAWRFWFVDRHRPPAMRGRPLGPLRRALLVVTAPVDAVLLAAAVVGAAWRGRLAEMVQYVRGLVDGALDRPLPLRRLGLR